MRDSSEIVFDRDLKGRLSAMIDDLIERRNIERHKQEFPSLGREAVPFLLEHLASDDLRRKKMALFGLQYCYSWEALNPLAELLSHEDAEIREYASIVVGRQEGLRKLADLCIGLIDHADKDIAAFALTFVEGELPDFERTKRVLADPELRETLWKFLPRYYSSDLTPSTQEMLSHERAEVGWSAAVSLIQQGDRGERTREVMTAWLGLPVAETREISAEYFTWLGRSSDLSALNRALQVEDDPHVNAALQAAVGTIEKRQKTYGTRDDSPSARSEDAALPSPDCCAVYEQALAELAWRRDQDQWERSFAWLCRAESGEPRWEYKGQEPTAELSRSRETRIKLQAELLCVPGPHGASADYVGERDHPAATTLIPPVRDYFDSKRTGYGKQIESGDDAFASLVHVGDDVHWYKDLRTVVAVAAGIVRVAGHLPTWGYLVIIEHATLYGERLCSLYAHLGPFLHVSPGQVVRQGQKIGVIGRSYTWANGGYAAHLHFAFHNGPYRQVFRAGLTIDVRYKGKTYRGTVLDSDFDQTLTRIRTAGGPLEIIRPTSWVAGYISKWSWNEGRHQWLDPQATVRVNLDPSIHAP